MRKTDTLFIGFMLFSMFFGAGNLIFPPMLGAQSGTHFWLAVAGFVATGVGLPFAVLFAISLVKGGVQTIGSRVHPIFSTAFIVLAYLSVGPFLAIPRNATVGFEMGVAPFLKDAGSSSVSLLIFSFVFFGLAYLVALDPEKLEKYMGRFITPLLLIAMVVLCVTGLFGLHGVSGAPQEGYQSGSFFTGFLVGYNTMDALGALAFGIVILAAIRDKGVQDERQLRRHMIKASVVAGVLLTVVYVMLALVGSRVPGAQGFAAGTEILSAAASQLFGPAGTILIGLIFTLACFTTVVGLTTACGHYFSGLLPKAGYKVVVTAVILIGFILSNLGLEEILKVSVPFLVTAYPLTIVLVVLTFFNRYFRNSRKVYATAILFAGVFAVLGGLKAAGLPLGPLETMREVMPLAKAGLDWIVPALVGTAIGLVFDRFGKDRRAENARAEEAVQESAV